MRWPRRTMGGFAALMGGIGLLACLAGVVTVWSMRTRIDNVLTLSFARIDTALLRVDETAQQTNQRVGEIRESLHDLDARVQRRVAKFQQLPANEAAGIAELEQRVYARFAQARSWIRFLQTSVELVEQLLGLIEGASEFFGDETHTAAELVAAVRAGHDELETAFSLLDDVQQRLAEIRASRNVVQNMDQLKTIYGLLDNSLENVAQFGREFSNRVATARSRLADLGDHMHRQLILATIAGTVVLLWFGLAQLCLSRWGWRAFTSSGKSGPSKDG